ncbi:MAG: hypothetical protein LBI29_04520, partial [Rickettsiales bacterium]|nr:hypothetical protein [Rickettsiales bacterium]
KDKDTNRASIIVPTAATGFGLKGVLTAVGVGLASLFTRLFTRDRTKEETPRQKSQKQKDREEKEKGRDGEKGKEKDKDKKDKGNGPDGGDGGGDGNGGPGPGEAVVAGAAAKVAGGSDDEQEMTGPGGGSTCGTTESSSGDSGVGEKAGEKLTKEVSPFRENENKLNHAFDNKLHDHNLDELVKSYDGNKEKLVDSIAKKFAEAAKNVDNKVLNNVGVKVTIGNFEITVKGSVVNGFARIGTFFIEKKGTK